MSKWIGYIWLKTGVKWRYLVNMIITLQFPQHAGNMSERLSASEEGFCSMELVTS
jgi:hypothetical protein